MGREGEKKMEVMREMGMSFVEQGLWGQGSILTGDESANKT